MNKVLNQEEILNRIIKESLKQYEKEKKEESRNKVLHNTRLLMKNYNALNNHVENTKEDIEDIELKFEGIELKEIWVMSVTKSKVKTIKMLAYIDSALDIIEKTLWEKGESHKFKAFELYYLEEKTNEEIRRILNCGINSIKRWIDSVLEELGVLLWGVEAITA